jgi:hypothetical protein
MILFVIIIFYNNDMIILTIQQVPLIFNLINILDMMMLDGTKKEMKNRAAVFPRAGGRFAAVDAISLESYELYNNNNTTTTTEAASVDSIKSLLVF